MEDVIDLIGSEASQVEARCDQLCAALQNPLQEILEMGSGDHELDTPRRGMDLPLGEAYDQAGQHLDLRLLPLRQLDLDRLGEILPFTSDAEDRPPDIEAPGLPLPPEVEVSEALVDQFGVER